MSNLLSAIEKIKSWEDKKLMIKVIAGILFIAVAFSVYLAKNTGNSEGIAITDTSYSQQSSTEPAVAAATDQAIDIPTEIIIDVSGAVVDPSVVKLKEGSRVYEAIEKSGGITPDAYTKTINLARLVTDGEKIYIPTKAEMENGETLGYPGNNQAYSHTAPGDSMIGPPSSQGSLININTADSTTLQLLTGIGPATADKIISYRNENGHFKSIDDIKNVSGIGEKTFEKFKNKITV